MKLRPSVRIVHMNVCVFSGVFHVVVVQWCHGAWFVSFHGLIIRGRTVCLMQLWKIEMSLAECLGARCLEFQVLLSFRLKDWVAAVGSRCVSL